MYSKKIVKKLDWNKLEGGKHKAVGSRRQDGMLENSVPIARGQKPICW